jgi:hypothetical protein
MVLAGLLFWVVAGLCGLLIPQPTMSWVYIFGVGVVFQAGIAISRALKVDIFAKGNSLGVLGGILGAVQILFGTHHSIIN